MVANERDRIADWLDERARLLDGPSGEESAVCLELHITASIIRNGEMGPRGMASSEPTLTGKLFP